jgi:hypothetical protein
LDLEGRKVGELGVERGDVHGVRGVGNQGEELLGEEATAEDIGTVLDEVTSLEGVVAVEGNVGKVGMLEEGLDLEGVGLGEGAVATEIVSEKGGGGLHRIGSEQKAADGSGKEAF